MIADHRLDRLTLTETWITSDTPKATRLDVAPTGYRRVPAQYKKNRRQLWSYATTFRNSMDVRPIDLGRLQYI